jgi:hypothetical protein
VPHHEVHVREELIEAGPNRPHESQPRAEHRLEPAAVVVLSLAVLATAWSGYHAARWSAEQAALYTEAFALRVKSAQQAGRARRIDDQPYFNGWLDAYASGDKRLAAIYRRRVRSEFVPTAKEHDDSYTLSTVFFAAVLLLAASRCVWSGGR